MKDRALRGDRFTFKTSRRPGILVGARLPMRVLPTPRRKNDFRSGGLAGVPGLADESQVQRYRFGLKTADFLVCRTCGTYIAAVLTTSRGDFATVNSTPCKTLSTSREAEPMSYEVKRTRNGSGAANATGHRLRKPELPRMQPVSLTIAEPQRLDAWRRLRAAWTVLDFVARGPNRSDARCAARRCCCGWQMTTGGALP